MSKKYRKQITDFLIKNHCDINEENIKILMDNYEIWRFGLLPCRCFLCAERKPNKVRIGLLTFLNEFQDYSEMKEVAFSNKFKDVIDV